eukprot:3445914-Heterocapsa_arctica.AAC.1
MYQNAKRSASNFKANYESNSKKKFILHVDETFKTSPTAGGPTLVKTSSPISKLNLAVRVLGDQGQMEPNFFYQCDDVDDMDMHAAHARRRPHPR